MANGYPPEGLDPWYTALQIFLGESIDLTDGTLEQAAVLEALGNSGVIPNTYGDGTHVPQITVNQGGIVTGVTDVAITGGSGTVSDITSTGSTITVTGGTGPTANVDLPAKGTAGTYGDSTHVAQVTTDTQGRVTGVSNVAISAGGSGTVTSVSVATANGYSGTVANPTTTPAITLTGPAALPPNGSAGGDLTGTYPNPTLSGTTNVESIITANTTVAGALQKTGGTMSGAIAMGTNKITGLTNGSGAQDAAAFGQIPTALPPNGSAGGALAGTYPNPTLAGVVTAGGPTGSATVVPVITYNAAGQLTTVTTANISGTVPGGSAGGDLTGTYPNPTVTSTANFKTQVETVRLDQMAAPTAAVVLNSQKITGLANGSAAQDAAAFGQIPTTLVAQFTTVTANSDPNPATVGTYYRLNYSGNFTLPSAGLSVGDWLLVKLVASSSTISIVGTVDGNASFTISTQYVSYWFIWNGTNWDIA